VRPVGGGEVLGGAEADGRGQFVVAGVPAGEFEAVAGGFVPGSPRRYESKPVRVSVQRGGTARVEIPLDLEHDAIEGEGR
jgi:hypothetical protein